MIGYGMAKAAVHQLVASLAGPDSGLPATAKVNAILPYVTFRITPIVQNAIKFSILKAKKGNGD